MKIQCITHADFETPGVIQDWAKNQNFDFQICKPYQGENCLNAGYHDLLIVMGGPQSPIEIEHYPYLADEITLIQQSIQAKKKILGFCLGAQLIGEAFGGRTERSPEKEIGFYPIELTEAGRTDPLLEGMPSTFGVIHWHNDMPGLTSGSVVLATSEGCPRQIVRYSPYAYGFQCHLEITAPGIKQLLAACPQDLEPSRFTQTRVQLEQERTEAINQNMKQILDRFINL